MIWMIFVKILKIVIYKKTENIDCIWWYDCWYAKYKKINPIVTEVFIRGRKLDISLVFITQSYFAVSKNIRLISPHCFVMKIPSKRELQQILFNHSSEIDFQYFISHYSVLLFVYW